jgi:hypothetical protein
MFFLNSIFPFSSHFFPSFENVQPKQVTELTSLQQSLKFNTANKSIKSYAHLDCRKELRDEV